MKTAKSIAFIVALTLVTSACGGGDAGDDFEAQLAALNATSASAGADMTDDTIEIVDPDAPLLSFAVAEGTIRPGDRLDLDQLTAASMTLTPDDIADAYPVAWLNPSETAALDRLSLGWTVTDEALASTDITGFHGGFRSDLTVHSVGNVSTEVYVLAHDDMAAEWEAGLFRVTAEQSSNRSELSAADGVAGLPGSGFTASWIETDSADNSVARRRVAFSSDRYLGVVDVEWVGVANAERTALLDAASMWFAQRLAERIHNVSSTGEQRDPEPAGFHSVADAHDDFSTEITVTFTEGGSPEVWRYKGATSSGNKHCQWIVAAGGTESLRSDARVDRGEATYLDWDAGAFVPQDIRLLAPLFDGCMLSSAASVGYRAYDRQLLDVRSGFGSFGDLTTYATSSDETFRRAFSDLMPADWDLVSYRQEVTADGWISRQIETAVLSRALVQRLYPDYRASGDAVTVTVEYRVVAVGGAVGAIEQPLPLGGIVQLDVGEQIIEVEPEPEPAEEPAEEPAAETGEEEAPVEAPAEDPPAENITIIIVEA